MSQEKINGLMATRLRKMLAKAREMREAHKYDVKQQYYDGEIGILKDLIKLIELDANP